MQGFPQAVENSLQTRCMLRNVMLNRCNTLHGARHRVALDLPPDGPRWRAARACVPRSQTPDRSPQLDVEVLLTTSDTLSASARAAFVRETESIWRRHGVAIHWLPPTESSPSGQYRLRALIVEKRSIPRTAGEFAIGELVGLAGSHQVAFVSIEDAQRLVTWTRRDVGYDLVALEERRLGVTLGARSCP